LSKDKNKNGVEKQNKHIEQYDFDLDKEKIADELVNFYKVFVPIIENNL